MYLSRTMGQILIVDDDEAVRKSVCRLLRSGGYPAGGAADGEAGLRAMQAARPALVLLLLLAQERERERGSPQGPGQRPERE